MSEIQLDVRTNTLPKWAQADIAHLERVIRELRERLAAVEIVANRNTEGFVYSVGSHASPELRSIPSHFITAQLPSGELNLSIIDGKLRVIAHGGSGDLVVLPAASNSVNLHITNTRQ